MKFPVLCCLIPFALAACTSTKPEPPPAPAGSSPADMDPSTFEIPTLTPLENGNIVVRFKKTGCSVLFDHDGKLLEGGRLCDDVNIYRAREAVKAHIAERSSNAVHLRSF